MTDKKIVSLIKANHIIILKLMVENARLLEMLEGETSKEKAKVNIDHFLVRRKSPTFLDKKK